MVTLQIIILFAAILLPLNKTKKQNISPYNIDKDTSNSTYAINEQGKLERINAGNPSVKNPRIQN